MRATAALILLTACVMTSGSSDATAADPLLTPPLPSATDSAPTLSPPMDMTMPRDHGPIPFTPSYEVYPPATDSSPPTTGYIDGMPRPSYVEVSSGYPAQSHSLVPSALSYGPMFIGAGSYGGAYAGGTHTRYPYHNYRSPWTYGGPASMNHTIVW